MGRTIRDVLILFASSVLLACAAAYWSPRWENAKDVLFTAPEQDLRELGAEAARESLWVDARTELSRAGGLIRAGALVYASDWDGLCAELVSRWKPGQGILVYGDPAQGEQARQLARRLRKDLGLDTVRVLIARPEEIGGELR